MATPGSLSDGEETDSRKSIYERSTHEASNSRDARLPLRLALGAMAGAVIAFVAAELGAHHIFGLSRLAALIPCIVLGGAIGATRFLRVLVLGVSVALLLLCIIAYTDVMRSPARRLIRADPMPQRSDAIVVLSAGVSADGMLPQQAVDRLLKGLELWRSGRAPRLVLTRELRKSGTGWISTASDQSRIISLAGQPEVIVTRPVASTRDEAILVAALARRGGWKRIILVTSPFHSRRACATFEKVGLEVACAPSESRDVAVRNRGGPDNRVRLFGMWIYEIAGALRYRQAGWID